MNAEEFYQYINKPESLKGDDVNQLNRLVEEFPYFQTAQLLLSLSSKKWDASLYQQTIKRTAISVNDREKLYDLLNKEIPVENIIVIETKPEVALEKSVQDTDKHIETDKSLKEETKVPEVKEEITPEKVEKEIERAIVSSFVEKEVLQIKQERKKQPDTFTAWLDHLNRNKGTAHRFEEEKKEAGIDQAENIKKTKLKQKALIDKIIESNPGALKQKEEQKFFRSDIKAKESLLENEELVTETLANIYALQGNISKAIRSYEILSLKYPQKSAYFASLIEKLRNSQKD